MARKSTASRHGLSFIGSLCAVLSVALLGSVGVTGYRWFVIQKTKQHLRAAIPKVYGELQGQREILVRAIEEYKRKLGFYPPDHVISREPLVVDAITNQLLYELLGTLHDPDTHTFTPEHFPGVKREFLKSFFNTEQFHNSALKQGDVNQFIKSDSILATVAVHNKPDVALAGYFPSWEGIEPDIFLQVPLSSWRYNSSAPAHNPGRYDLWIEVNTLQTNIVLGNW